MYKAKPDCILYRPEDNIKAWLESWKLTSSLKGLCQGGQYDKTEITRKVTVWGWNGNGKERI